MKTPTSMNTRRKHAAFGVPALREAARVGNEVFVRLAYVYYKPRAMKYVLEIYLERSRSCVWVYQSTLKEICLEIKDSIQGKNVPASQLVQLMEGWTRTRPRRALVERGITKVNDSATCAPSAAIESETLARRADKAVSKPRNGNASNMIPTNRIMTRSRSVLETKTPSGSLPYRALRLSNESKPAVLKDTEVMRSKGSVPSSCRSRYSVYSGSVPGHVWSIDIPVHPALSFLIPRVFKVSNYKSSGEPRFSRETAGGFILRNTNGKNRLELGGTVKWGCQYPDTYGMLLGFIAADAWPRFAASFPEDASKMLDAVEKAYGKGAHPIPGTGWTNFHIGEGGCRMHFDRPNLGLVTNWTIAGENLLVIDNLKDQSLGRKVAIEQAAGRATVFDANELKHGSTASPGRVVISLYTSQFQLKSAGRGLPHGGWDILE